jgi:PPK2 family polyphosphate:nucleotide phosphotransferase
MAETNARAIRVEPKSKVDLTEYDPADTRGIAHDEADERVAKLADELAEVQELLYGAAQQSVLIVLQGMDTSGKDGTISHVMAPINPQGCIVSSFKQPTPVELAHDFLWRIHPHAPAKGMMGIFNRSHYEDVLVVRVHDLVPKAVWRERYDLINNFEQSLARNGTIILKFFLHISKEEQEERLLAREADKTKAWKLSATDWAEREHWGDYQEAYEDALGKCSTKEAPWYIVPANHKWYRNLAITETILDALRPNVKMWSAALEARGKEQLEALRAMRAQANAKA